MKHKKKFLFGTRSYRIMAIGGAFIVLGFILMTGGGSEDPNVFNPEIYSPLRIRLAPSLVVFGFSVLIIAILSAKTKS